jgi:hypothetical protein
VTTGLKNRGAGRGPDVIDRPPLGHEETYRVCVVDQLVCCRPSLALGREAGGPRVTSTHHWLWMSVNARHSRHVMARAAVA